MPTRATKRGAERTDLDRDCDVLICGASFAGLAIARELAATGADVIVIDRYEIGERQTSACGIPTRWLEVMDLTESLAQTFPELVIHTPYTTVRYDLPWTFSTVDYRALCGLLAAQGKFEFETAKVEGRDGSTVHTDRGEIRAPLIVDALGWRRVLGSGEPIQPPDAYLSRGLEVHPHGQAEELEIWIDRKYVPAGYGWSFPADHEVRVGVGSFDPRFHVKDTTVQLTQDLGREPAGYQGNWIPHKLRDATQDGIFFVGDSAGHCLPLTAEGIRTALYFGLACGRELRAVLDGRRSRDQALSSYGAFSDGHERKYRWLLNVQRAIGRLTPSPVPAALGRAMESRRVAAWTFEHYFAIAPASFVGQTPRRPPAVSRAVPAASAV